MPNLRREFSRRGLLSGAWRANAVPTAVRPPGAVGEEQFVGLCDGCGACAQACPVGAVQMTGPRVANGAPSPQIIAAAAACTMCEGLVCSTACPQGALTRTTPGSMRIAEVEFHPRGLLDPAGYRARMQLLLRLLPAAGLSYHLQARLGSRDPLGHLHRLRNLRIPVPGTAQGDCRRVVRSLPIRLTPMTATCRVPPLSRVKLGIGWSRGVARDAEQ